MNERGGYRSINGETGPQRRTCQKPTLEQHSNKQSDLREQNGRSAELICGELDERCWVLLVGVIAGMGALARSRPP